MTEFNIEFASRWTPIGRRVHREAVRRRRHDQATDGDQTTPMARVNSPIEQEDLEQNGLVILQRFFMQHRAELMKK